MAAVVRDASRAAMLLVALALGAPSAQASLALAPGDLVVVESGSPQVVHGIGRGGGEWLGSCPCSTCGSVSDVAATPARVFVATRLSGDAGPEGGIVAIEPATCAERTLSSGDLLHDVAGLALDLDGSLLASDWCASCGTDRIVRIDPQSGAQSLVYADGAVRQPRGLDVAPDGRIYVAAVEAATAYGGVLRIDPTIAPATGSFVAIGDDTGVPAADRQDLIGPVDVAIEASDGPVYVLDTRFRGSSLQDEWRLVSADLALPPVENQSLLTRALEGINRARTSGRRLGLDATAGRLYALDRVFSTGPSSDLAGIIEFDPATSTDEGRAVTDPSAFFDPDGLAVVAAPEPAPGALAAAAGSALAVWRRRSLGRRVQQSTSSRITPGMMKSRKPRTIATISSVV